MEKRKLVYADNVVEKLAELILMDDHEKQLLDSFVEKCIAVDARLVVHGQWLRNPVGTKHFCSVCGNGAFNKNFAYGARYCPICGARMDGERKNNG